MEEHQREAAGSGRAGERRRCSVKKVRIDSTVDSTVPPGFHTKVVFVFISRQLVDRFNCLSCDRPIVKYTHTQ